VQQATKVELIINMKTAKRLGSNHGRGLRTAAKAFLGRTGRLHAVISAKTAQVKALREGR
jgi:hypothetical protein